MSMFQVSGQVVHVYDAPQVVDKQTGEITREEKPKVQIVGDLPLPNGQLRYDIITLSVEDKTEWEALQGRRIAVPLGFFAPSKGNIVYFIPKGCHPRPAGELPGPQVTRDD